MRYIILIYDLSAFIPLNEKLLSAASELSISVTSKSPRMVPIGVFSMTSKVRDVTLSIGGLSFSSC